MKKRNLLLAFFLSVLLGTIITLPTIIWGRGIFHLLADFDVQQIPFLMTISDSIKKGEIFWSWSNEMGSSFIGSYSFYNLLSPFNIILYIFPASFIKYMVGPMIILKYGFAGLTSYLFIRRYTKTDKMAILGSLLYAFSGFQLTNIVFYHFHDIVALFPLLLYTFDNLVYDNKKISFGVMVFISALTNWFFFIGEVFFLIIYYLVKVFCKEIPFNIRKLLSIIIEGALGVGLAFFVLYPVLIYTMGNPRLSTTWTLKNALVYPLVNYIEIIRALLTPPETMHYRAIMTPFNYTSIELYLPVVGIALVIPYILKNKKKWDSILILICLLFLFIPILNSSFIAFQTTYYARWAFMPLLIMALVSVKCLEKDYNINSGVIGTLIGFIVLLSLVLCHSRFINKDFVFDQNYLLLIIVFTIINLLLVFVICKGKKKNKCILLVLSVFLFVSLWGNYMIYKEKNKNNGVEEYYVNFLNSGEILNKYQNNRSNSDPSCSHNFGYVSKIKNLKSWNSNISGSSFDFLKSVGYGDRSVSTNIPISDTTLNNILGVEYIISCNKDDNLEKYNYKIKGSYNIFDLYRNPDAYKMGFVVNKYISQEEFTKMTYEDRKTALGQKVVLNNWQIKKYKGLFYNDVAFTNMKFKYTKNGFRSNVDSSDDALIIYQVPFDKGWKATVNDKNVDVERVDNGLIAIKINKGKNKVEFTYMPPGLKKGALVSFVFLILYGIYIIYILKGGKHEKS